MAAANVISTANAVGAARSRVSDQRRKQLASQIEDLQVLPTSMTVPMHVLRLQRAAAAGLDDYAAAVSKDAGLAAKILALVNSVAFAPAKPITRLSQAVPMIGLKGLLPLVFSLSLGGIFNRMAMPTEDRAAWFKASLLRGLAAQYVATALGAKDRAEEAFLCGLMLDVGVPVLCGCDRSAWSEATTVLDLQDPVVQGEREEAIYGTSHPEVGRLVAERMGLPGLFADAVAMHHRGAAAMSAVIDPALARAIDVAATIPHRMTTPQQAAQRLAGRLRTLPETAAPAEATRVLQEIMGAYASTLRLLGDEDDTGAPFKQFLQDIAAVVAGSVCVAVGDAQSTITGLRAKETGLNQQVEGLRQQVLASDFDVLTRVFNRGAFMKRLPTLLAALRQHQSTCAIGYVDVDNFKLLNDNHGHAAGDAALRHVAERLTEVVQPRGLVGRVGGDEFVFAVVSRLPLQADEVARRFGPPLTSLSIVVGDRTVPFTTSVGLFDAGIPAEADTAESLFAQADKLMYGSKRAGKGRCVFARLAESSGEAA